MGDGVVELSPRLETALRAHTSWLEAMVEDPDAAAELAAFRVAFLAVPAAEWNRDSLTDVELAGLDVTTRYSEALEHPERTVALLDRVLARHSDSELAVEARETRRSS